MTPEETPLAAWMIYPGVKSAVRACAMAFCICSALVALIHQSIPFLFYSATAAALFHPLMAIAGAGAVISLACIVFWSARALLASQGSYVTRVLSGAGLLLVPYVLLVLLGPMPLPLKHAEILNIMEAALLLAGITALFALPYAQGYPARGRKLLTTWAVLAVLYAILEALAPLYLDWVASQHWNESAQATALALCGGVCGIIELVLTILSVRMGLTLFSRVMHIASMPERKNPVFPAKEP